MTSVPILRPPLQPTLKAASTAQSSQLQAVAGQTPVGSRSSSQVRQSRPVRQEANNDFLSDKATLSLIRRMLVADGSHGSEVRTTPKPIEAVLPPLTSSNDVDVQLYAIIAIVIKDFIKTWYSKITPDHTFVEEVIQVIAHCSRAIEQRLRQIDVVELTLDEIPALVQQHIEAYKAANDSHAILSYGSKPTAIYHTLNHHPALSPNLSIDEQHRFQRTYRQLLVQGLLALLLPTEDLQNSCLRILVTDIIADLILGRAIDDRLCKGWFLHETVSKVLATITSQTQPKVTGAEIQADARSRLEKFGLLSAKSQGSDHNSPDRRQSTFSSWFWMLLQWVYLASLSVRFFVTGMMHARRLPPRWRYATSPASPTTKSASSESQSSIGNDRYPRLVLDFRIFAAVSTLLNLSRRMPWLKGSLCFWQHVLTSGTARFGRADSVLDKFLYDNLEKHVLTAALVPLTLKNVRATIFPGNTMGPPAPPPPSDEEARQIRRKAAEDILSVVPPFIATTFFATDSLEEILEEVEEDILDVFGNESMNKHLIYGILELIVVRLVPELAEKTPSELLAERGVLLGGEEKDAAAG